MKAEELRGMDFNDIYFWIQYGLACPDFLFWVQATSRNLCHISLTMVQKENW